MTHLATLVDHCTWANQAWIDLLARDASGDVYLQKLMSHILLGERAWFQRIRAQTVDREVWRVMPLDELSRAQHEHTAVYAELLRGDTGRVVGYRRFTGKEYQSPLSDILLHLCTHGMHHRGQMATHASRQGIRFPNTDFINFCIVNQR